MRRPGAGVQSRGKRVDILEMMDFKELKQILEMVREHDLSEFELEGEGFKLRIRKNGLVQMASVATAPAPVPPAPVPAVAPANTPDQAASAAPPPEAVAEEAADTEIELAVVKSPIVGTFYRAPEPSGVSFVEIGDNVKKGQVLCIIEAMKLMNEIDSEYDGEIVSIYVENGQPVQYGERLFAIRTR